MKIDLSRPHMSIATLTTEDLPDFAVLIGRNGVGKTQILDALKEGAATVPDVSENEVEMYNMTSFFVQNSGHANRNSDQFARNAANAYVSQQGGQSLVGAAKAIFDECAKDVEDNSGVQARSDFEQRLRREIQQIPDFVVFARTEREDSYEKAIYEQVLRPLIPEENRGRNNRNRPADQPSNSFNSNPAALVSAAMKLASKLPHELVYDDIMRASHYEGNTLSNSISAVFAAYRVNQYLWAHKRVETEPIGFPELIAEYQDEYPPPWETLRETLSAMRDASRDDELFNFDFSDPTDHELNMGNYEQFTFKAEMTNHATGTQYELSSLSSGEKVLMALCLASFNQHLGRRRPKLLLLDEIDAVLHPSMVAALVGMLKALFVSGGTKVLMTSHSPMTVAALDEADIFRVARVGGDVRVSRTTKSEAISELSEGLATVDTGLKIAAYDEAKVAILTEGNNAKHLKRWATLNFPRDVHVVEGLEQYSGKDQLLMYGRMLAKMNTSTHFVIVWDCDATGMAKTLCEELPEYVKVTPFAFTKRPDNAIARNGIENNYDEKILETYSTTTRDSNGALVSRGFQSNRKTEFANHVLEEGTRQYFVHFRGLHDVVSKILGFSSPEVLQ